MPLNSCENCVHCVADLTDKQLNFKCRRYPPQTHVVPVQHMGQVGMQVMTLYPQVTKNDICGEFVSKPPVIIHN